RHALAALLRARGAQPVAAEAAYRLPFAVHTAAAAVALAIYLEDGLATAYLGMVAVIDAATRKAAGLALQQCAVRAAAWRGASVAFPGMPAGGAQPAPRPGR